MQMKKKKTNPKKKPISKVAKEAMIRQESVNNCWAIIMTVLIDKFDFSQDDIEKAWNEVQELSDSIVKGYVNKSDLKKVLKEESGIILN